MKYTHTVQFAFGLNIRVLDDAGRPVSLYIMPVMLWFFWLPAIVVRATDITMSNYQLTMNKIAGLLVTHRPLFIVHYSLLIDFAGWRRDLPLIWRALAGWGNWPAGEVVYG
jgi:hypothetical protein